MTLTASAPFVLRVRSGRRVNQRVVLSPGQTLKVGRDLPADFVVPEDNRLLQVHFTLTHAGDICALEDQKTPEGTEVNARKVDALAHLDHGAWIRAGQTDFMLYREAHTPPLDDVEVTPEKQRALEDLSLLQRGFGAEPPQATGAPSVQRETTLFGIFDAARDMRVLEVLRESVEDIASLYEGMAGEMMADGAPYLVAFPPRAFTGNTLLERVVLEGWGQAWGIYLTSSRPILEVRRHLRRFLLVINHETEERLYFRFYDPRVLRVFLPTCLPKQRADFFGDVEIDRFWMEGETGEVRKFEKEPSDVGT